MTLIAMRILFRVILYLLIDIMVFNYIYAMCLIKMLKTYGFLFCANKYKNDPLVGFVRNSCCRNQF